MSSRVKMFGALIVLLAVLAVAYVVVVSFTNFGSKEKSKITISGREIIVEIVETPLAQARGLAGRDTIADDEGMLFVFSRPGIQNFWMKGMKFPIDIIWIKDNVIAGFEENVPPEPGVSSDNLKIYSSPEPVARVLEMKAGSVRNLGIQTGTPVNF